jgi:dephospho-CoA kinase
MRHVRGYLLIGQQGSGRGIVSSVLVDRLGYKRLSILDAAREELVEGYRVDVAKVPGYVGKEGQDDLRDEFALINCRDRDFTDVAVERFSKRGGTDQGDLSNILRAPRSRREILHMWVDIYRNRASRGYNAYWLERIQAALEASPGERFVIADGAAPAEAMWAKEHDLGVVLVHRPGLPVDSEAPHEDAPLRAIADDIIENDGDQASLVNKVLAWAQESQ